MKTFLHVMFIVCFTASGLYAHELWIERADGSYRILYGHRSEGEHKGEIVPYKSGNVLDVKCFDSAGQEIVSDVQKNTPVSFKGNCAVVYSVFSSGYWTKTVTGTKNISRDKAKTPIYSWYSMESVKRIDAWGEAIKKPLTDSLEIVLLHDPLKLKNGEKLRLLVTFNKKPLENVVVTYDEKPRGTTDRAGRVNLRVRHSGFQMISASYKNRNKKPSIKADETIYTANLNFEVK